MINIRQLYTSFAYKIFLLLLMAIIVPIFLNDYLIHILIMILLYGYMGQCWNIICGYTGMFSLGHAAFFGIGGYLSTYLLIKLNLSPWIGTLLVSAVLAMILGIAGTEYIW